MSDAAYERLSPEDLGLAPGTRMPVRFVPARAWSPLVISFPHVGLAWPHDLPPKPQVDFPRNADYDVHTLYDFAPHSGAASVAAIYSRLVADLNRADDDVSRTIVPDHPAPRPRTSPGIAPNAENPEADVDAGRPGRGVVWAAAIGNVSLLRGPLPYARFRDRIDRFHAPYYRALQTLLERRRARFGYAVLLDAHSMPGSVGPDLVLGTLDGRACDPGLQQAALSALRRDHGADGSLRVMLNRPYLGGELVRRFGRPHEGLHALQLEVSRALYMDEQRYRLYEHDRTTTGTDGVRNRATVERASISRVAGDPGMEPHRSGISPDPRRARRLGELRQRIDSLVRCLASQAAGPDPRLPATDTRASTPVR
ncbi:MAG: N-formylglutamate amidohydrolase [Nannocystaceae bacterium]